MPNRESDLFASRNQALGFAQRARKNLEFVSNARREGADVHEVTQIATSLLGLVVFPWEEQLVQSLPTIRLAELSRGGWPEWEVSLGSAATLDDLMRHVRNATAHGRVSFSSESQDPGSVRLTVEDAKPKSGEVYWRASIRADQLGEFFLKLLSLIESKLD